MTRGEGEGWGGSDTVAKGVGGRGGGVVEGGRRKLKARGHGRRGRGGAGREGRGNKGSGAWEGEGWCGAGGGGWR